ncbi:hypothetical protein FNV43_RR24569 [Rhamnella rubrinervis]|uniref:Uncharacterized protein n=1 Tax=Rhamnella rubrinervis TaxID=2594499 RepID=A0A8K0GLC1_9ROSA|nr:hypothetical protein FNV43_RR24569 [Rhamnella rubrinervis]
MLGKIVCSRGEVSDAESHYKPSKKGSKVDPIALSDLENLYRLGSLVREGKRRDVKYDEAVRRKFMKELEKDDFDCNTS